MLLPLVNEGVVKNTFVVALRQLLILQNDYFHKYKQNVIRNTLIYNPLSSTYWQIYKHESHAL